MDLFPNLELFPPRQFRELIMVGLGIRNPADPLDAMCTDEAINCGLLQLNELPSANVNLIEASNKGNQPILMLAGEEIVGARQNRILNTSIWLNANASARIPVSCVEHGRWNEHTATFQAAGTMYFPSSMAHHTREVTRGYQTRGQAVADQSRVWSDVQDRLNRTRTRTSTQSMHTIFENFAELAAEYETQLRPDPEQCGFVFMVGGQVLGLHLLESADYCQQVFHKYLRSYVLDLAAAPDPQPAKPADADVATTVARFLKQLRSAECMTFASAGSVGQDLRLSGPRLSGSALQVNGRLVQLSAYADGLQMRQAA